MECLDFLIVLFWDEINLFLSNPKLGQNWRKRHRILRPIWVPWNNLDEVVTYKIWGSLKRCLGPLGALGPRIPPTQPSVLHWFSINKKHFFAQITKGIALKSIFRKIWAIPWSKCTSCIRELSPGIAMISRLTGPFPSSSGLQQRCWAYPIKIRPSAFVLQFKAASLPTLINLRHHALSKLGQQWSDQALYTGQVL